MPFPPSPRPQDTDRYARCIETSKRIRWDIDRDVIRGRSFDFGKKFLPDGLSKVDELAFLQPAEARLLSQIQGRTYANMFALVERFIGAKTTELGRDHALGDQVAFEALVRLTDEELKHQEMFRRLERMAAVGMPVGYGFLPQPDEVAARGAEQVELGGARPDARHRAVQPGALPLEHRARRRASPSCGRTCSCSTGRRSRSTRRSTSSSGAARTPASRGAERDRGVDELIELVGAVDGICQMQARADADFFLSTLRRAVRPAEAAAVHAVVLKAYRWQYIVSGAQEPRFQQVLKALVTPAQMQRILHALAPFFADA